MTSSLIRYAGVAKEFAIEGKALTVLQSVDLDVRQGEVLTLVGPSGCGKSTLLNMVAGLFRPSGGSVHYDGQEVLSLNPRVGYMTQSDHLLPWRTVAGNISAPLEISGLRRRAAAARVEELLQLVGLVGFERSYPGQISGGMRKRTALARLLAYDPETLLLDEPFGALDAQLRWRLQIELRKLVKRLGKTVLFVTHDLEEAISVGDRCVVFSARPGRILDIIEIPLPADRSLTQLRLDDRYATTYARLWELLSPEIGA